MRTGAAALLFVLSAACVHGERTAPAVAAAPAVVDAPPAPVAIEEPVADEPPAPVAFDAWRGFGPGGCAYLAPKHGAVAPDGGVDVLFHFHAGQMSDRELRASALDAVIVSCGWGVGTTPYARAFADRDRFDRMLRALLAKVGASHVRRLALASWSAGFASIAKILAVPRYYAMTDAVVLLDSLHSSYDANGEVDVRRLDVFVRFARDAVRGEKTMVMTHSAIVPPGYASSTEATRALLAAIEIPTEPPQEGDLGGGTMRLIYRAEAGDLHVRGFRGMGPHDHFDHLHLVGEVLRSWVVPRWKTDRRLVYTRAGEQR